MLVGLYIFIDDDFDTPLYADPPPVDLDEALWSGVCEVAQDVFEEERDAKGTMNVGDVVIAWRGLVKAGVTFVVVVRDIKVSLAETYLTRLVRRYTDEVEDPRTPDRAGVEDVVVDVIPPWEEDSD